MGGTRGQALFAYLHTYGWLLAIFILAFIFLYREGLIFPEREINPSCMGFDTLSYVTHHIARDGTFSITIKNYDNEAIILRKMLVTWGELEAEWNGGKAIGIDDRREVSFGGVDLDQHSGYVYRVDIAITYERGGFSNRTDSAICVGKIMRSDRLG